MRTQKLSELRPDVPDFKRHQPDETWEQGHDEAIAEWKAMQEKAQREYEAWQDKVAITRERLLRATVDLIDLFEGHEDAVDMMLKRVRESAWNRKEQR